jgi:nicotine blue oxidoreductase
MSVAGLLLAAGSGSRLGRPKALLRFDGELLVERGVRLLRDGGTGPVTVVLGASAQEVLAETDLEGAVSCLNPDWPTGMASSLRAGLAAVGAGEAAAVVVALVDQPLVGPTAIRRLVSAWRDGAVVAVACYDGKPRNPVLLDRSVWSAVADQASGDAGARAFLRAHPDLVTPVACDDTGSAYDIDTEADLRAAAELRAAAHLSTAENRGAPACS